MNPKDRFVYHVPTDDMVEWMTRVRTICSALDDLLLKMPSHPRYTGEARTHLEIVSMMANKGIVFIDETE